jgi:hypothetical protein
MKIGRMLILSITTLLCFSYWKTCESISEQKQKTCEYYIKWNNSHFREPHPFLAWLTVLGGGHAS